MKSSYSQDRDKVHPSSWKMISSAPSRVNLTQEGDLAEYDRAHGDWRRESRQSQSFQTNYVSGQSGGFSVQQQASPVGKSEKDTMRMRLGMK